jgi:putative intracellular protease/amidase
MAATTVHLAVYDTMSDWETGYATAHINNGNWQRQPGRFRVVTVGETGEAVTSMGGLRITPEVKLDELRSGDSAMLILPGADTWMTGGNAAFANKAREFLDSGVPVAAICGATIGLATAGLLDDRDHTGNHPAPLAETGYRGGDRYRDELVVTDRGLVTAGAMAPVEFARAVFAELGLYEPDVLASWYKLYGEQNPDGFFELMRSAA